MDTPSAEDFARIAQELHEQPGVVETVDQVVKYACPAIGCDFADVVFVQRRKKIEVTASTDPLAEKAVQRQAELGEGPTLDLMTADLRIVVVYDLGSDPRWPRWRAELTGFGIHGLISVRLATNTSVLGALNLYWRDAGGFDEDDVGIAYILARHASVALAAARQEETLWEAIDARKAVGQAQGILMERFDIDADQAFAVLRRYSQDHNIKLNRVARELVATRRLPPSSKQT